MELFDKDGDGFLNKEELEATPGLKAAIKEVDTDGDGKIAKDEIQRRLEFWQETKSALLAISVTVTMNGQPLPEATVTFEPEPFLGEAFHAAVGVTGPDGVCLPMLPPEHQLRANVPGTPTGFYRVRISKMVNGREIIPERYNSNTELGQEVANMAAGIREGIQFRLTRARR